MKFDRNFLLLLFLVVLSRIPLLIGGFGSDGDGWRIAKSALMLWNEGEYHVSRFPGFPVYEILMTPVIGMGKSPASNIATLGVFLISIIIFREIISHLNLSNKNILIISYAFLPILWKNSALTMDYVWGLCGILLSFLMLLKQRFFIAGIVLGFAAGTRVTHIAYVLPFFFLFEGNERKQWFIFSSVAVISMIACYIPVIFSNHYGQVVTDYIADTRMYSMWKLIAFFIYRLMYSLGLLGFVSIVIVIVLNQNKIKELLTLKIFRVSVLSIITALIVFAILSDEREYLIPMMPFLLLAVAFLTSPIQTIITSALLISYAFISVDLIEHSIASPRPKIHLEQGFVLKELNDRKVIEHNKNALVNAIIPDSSIIMIGMGPLFWLENSSVQIDREMEMEFGQDCARLKNSNEVYFMYGLYLDQLKELQQRGYQIYYWNTMKEYLETFIGYKLNEKKVLPLVTEEIE